MAIMTHAKFHFSRLMLTLILASGPLRPWAWRTTEKAGPDRVNPIGLEQAFSRAYRSYRINGRIEWM